MRWFLLFFLILIYYCRSSDNGPIISVPPFDTVGCYDGPSTFYCESDRSDITLIQWVINGNTLTDETAQLRGILFNTNGGNSSLSIIGSEVNNGITIGCNVVTSGPPYVESKGALFTVTDIPPVMNLTITFTTNGTGVMMCTWSQPSCLPINYTYSISVNNVSMINTTSTVYSMSNISSCTHYTVSVTVIDTQDQSISEAETARRGLYEEITLRTSGAVYFNDNLHRFINITFKFFKYTNLSKLIHDCKINFVYKILSPDYSQSGEMTVNDLLQSYDESTGIGSYTIGPFNESFIGNYTLVLKKHFSMEPLKLDTIKISTFHVQEADISQLSNGSIEIVCGFAINSSADGCSVVFVNIQSHDLNETLFIPKGSNEIDTATMNTVIPPGEYSVSVYDVIDEATQTSTPAVTLDTRIDPTSSPVVPSIEDSPSLSLPPTIPISSSTVLEDSVTPSSTKNTPLLWIAAVVFSIFVIAIVMIFVVVLICWIFRQHSRSKHAIVSYSNAEKNLVEQLYMPGSTGVDMLVQTSDMPGPTGDTPVETGDDMLVQTSDMPDPTGDTPVETGDVLVPTGDMPGQTENDVGINEIATSKDDYNLKVDIENTKHIESQHYLPIVDKLTRNEDDQIIENNQVKITDMPSARIMISIMDFNPVRFSVINIID